MNTKFMSEKKTKEQVLKQINGSLERLFLNLPFVCFLALLGVIYIANTHYAERNLRKIHSLEKQIDEARGQYIEAKSDVIYKGMQSQLVKSVKKGTNGEVDVHIPKRIKVSES